MADRSRSPREIERELEQERAELRETLQEMFSRFTFEEVWTRLGAYMRENRGDYGHSFGRALKEKPLAVALTTVGVAWLLFGPPQQAPQGREPHRGPGRYGRNGHARMKDRLKEAEFAARSARGPSGRDAQTDPWEAPSRTPRSYASAGATGVTGAAMERGSGTGSVPAAASPAASRPGTAPSPARDPQGTGATEGAKAPTPSTTGGSASRRPEDETSTSTIPRSTL